MEHEVVSCDVEEWAEPDLVADVRDLPLPDDYADISACFQVLEHLPYDEVGRALAELRRVTRRRIVISVPHVTLHLVLGLKLPSRPMRTFFVPFGDPFFVRFDGPKEPAFHCWELGYRGYSRRGFERLLRSTGLTVTGRFRNPYLPWHHFFILEV